MGGRCSNRFHISACQEWASDMPRQHRCNRKMELCSQCYIRHKSLEVVYVEFEDGQSKLMHSARQNGRYAAKCKRFVSALTDQEKAEWRAALQTMKRNGKWGELHQKTKASCTIND